MCVNVLYFASFNSNRLLLLQIVNILHMFWPKIPLLFLVSSVKIDTTIFVLWQHEAI